MRRKRGALKRWEMNLRRWIDGDWENVWKEACLLEQRRYNIKRRRANQRGKQHIDARNASEEAALRTWIRAKNLVNDGEFSKAARDINEAGVVKPNQLIVEQLRKKYPN